MVRTPGMNPERHIRPNERIYYHYEDLEEYHAGMWRIVRGETRKGLVIAAANLMKIPNDFKASMQEALKLWPKSCDHNLTAESVNRIAWLEIGRAHV